MKYDIIAKNGSNVEITTQAINAKTAVFIRNIEKSKIDNDFRIGILLSALKDLNSTDKEFKITDYCMDNFGYKRAECNKLIQLANTFAYMENVAENDNSNALLYVSDNGEICLNHFKFTTLVDIDGMRFGRSQLEELLPLSDKEIEISVNDALKLDLITEKPKDDKIINVAVPLIGYLIAMENISADMSIKSLREAISPYKPNSGNNTQNSNSDNNSNDSENTGNSQQFTISDITDDKCIITEIGKMANLISDEKVKEMMVKYAEKGLKMLKQQ